MQRPVIQLQRRRKEYQVLSDKVLRLSDNADADGEQIETRTAAHALSDPAIASSAPAQVMVSRNGVGKSTIANHILMLGQDEGNNLARHHKAPKRLDQQMEEGRDPIPVSEAVAEVVDETETLCSCMRMGQIQYIRNPVPYTNHAQQEQDDERLTKGHIRGFVNSGAPEAHIEQRSFLLNTGCHAGTTTHSSLQLQHGHIPGAVERFKSSQLLKSDAYEYVQLACSESADPQQMRKLSERYKRITGLTPEDRARFPQSADAVVLCKNVAEVAGKTRLYSGHADSIVSFRFFLRDRLIANTPSSPNSVHVALDSTTIYWPSSSVVVPLIDTPGVGDANILNEATTHAAIDEAILNSSQLLICGTKSLDAEAVLAPLIIPYMQFMIRDTQVTPCIRAVLLPETSGSRYSHRTVCSLSDQQAREEKIANSTQQLQKWMQQANDELPEQHRAQSGRLAALLQRCKVRVAYMNLYASLCLQSHHELGQLAQQASSDDRPVGVSDLLEATGGPWLLGLSSQLAAQTVIPAMEELLDVHVEQLVRTLSSRQTSTEHGRLSHEGKKSLADGLNKLKRNESLQLRKENMLRKITSQMAALKTEICQTFAMLGQACQQDCIEQTNHIEEQWDKRLSGTTMANLSNSLARVQSVPKTAAYRTTFGNTGLQASMGDVLKAVEDKAASCLTAFAKQHVFTEIVTDIVECLRAYLPESAHTALEELVETVAEGCVMPSLDGLVKRFSKRLLHPTNLKASLRGVQASCVGMHLLRGALPITNEAACRDELSRRIARTLSAAQSHMPSVFDDHVHAQVQGFIGFLTRNGNRYRGGVERFTRTLTKELSMHCRGYTQGAEAVKDRSLYDEAVALQQAILQDLVAIKEQATTPLTTVGLGLAASLHRAATLAAHLEQHPDLEFLGDKPVSNPASQPLVHPENWLSVQQNWAKLAETNLQGSFTKKVQQRLLWDNSLGLPSWSDEEWQQISDNSLPAALQHHIWPAQSRISPRSELVEQQRLWKGIRIAIAHTLIGVWDETRVQSWLHKNLSRGGESVHLEQYMKRICEPKGQMGLLELLAFLMSHIGDSNTQDLCVQLWMPDQAEPLFLTNLPSTELTESSRSRRTFVCNLLAVTLPESQQVVWLPLDNAGHTEITGQWQQRLHDLDEQMVAANLEEASASGSTSQSPAQSTIPGLGARGRRQGGGVGHSKMTSSKRARRG